MKVREHVDDRFARLTIRHENGCLLWLGTKTKKGYGTITTGGRHSRKLVHRWAYEKFVGPIPAGLQLDHVCHNADTSCPGGETCIHRGCADWTHLEPVTNHENSLRSPHTLISIFRATTHCPKGHEYTEANTYRSHGSRSCRICRAMTKPGYTDAARIAIEAGNFGRERTTCDRGHPLSVMTDGAKRCRECRNASRRTGNPPGVNARYRSG